MIKSTKPASICVHQGYTAQGNQPLAMPIYQTSTFVFDSCEAGGAYFSGELPGAIYTRLGNPNFSAVEACISALEGSEDSALTASGMGAIAATMWTLLATGNHVIAAKTLYGCTFSLFSHHLTKFGINLDFVDLTDLACLRSKLCPQTTVVFFETPTNPDLTIYDIRQIASIVHQYNPAIRVIVDNTFATPILQQPLKLGADLVIHSATKFLNGHSDVLAGVVSGRAELIHRIKQEGLKDMTGAVSSPHDAFLLLRGLKTLPIRLARQNQQAQKIAEALATHPAIAQVIYPGLTTHPQHQLAKIQMAGFGSMISFKLTAGDLAATQMLNRVKLCSLAVSLGCVHTLIQHPASMTHSSYTPDELQLAGISTGLIRLSVGIEDSDDIIDDLYQALSSNP